MSDWSRRESLWTGISLFSGGFLVGDEGATYWKNKENSEAIENLEERVSEIESDLLYDQQTINPEYSFFGTQLDAEVDLDLNLKDYDSPRHLAENRPEAVEVGAEIFDILTEELDASDYNLTHNGRGGTYKLRMSEEELVASADEEYREAFNTGEIFWEVY